MVAKGSLGKFTPGKPSAMQYWTMVSALLVYSVGMGYFSGIQPINEWRYFSWHPFLMVCGMIGFAGIGAVTKKLGGYSNTKLHAILGFASLVCSFGGMYVIYTNKEMSGRPHLTSSHSLLGFLAFVSCFFLGMAGSIFLHPDFGILKTDKTIRFAHKWASRVALLAAWITAFLGLQQLIPTEGWKLLAFGLPLVAFVPFTLM